MVERQYAEKQPHTEKRERFTQSSSVFLFLVDTKVPDSSKILLIKRANTGWMDGYYSVPAGAIERGETPLQAVRRETEEEVGVSVGVKDVQLTHLQSNLTGGNQWLGIYYVATEWQGEPAVQEPEKHSEVTWAPINDLPENTIPYVRQAIEAYQNGEQYSEYGWNEK